MRRISALLAAPALAFSPSLAHAQETPVHASSEAEALAPVRRAHSILLTAPDPDSSGGVPREPYAITVSTDNNVLALTLAPVKPRFTGGREEALTITLKTPLSAALAEQLGTTVTDQGLSDKLSATLSYTLVRTDFGATVVEAAALETIMKECRLALSRQLGRPATNAQFQEACKSDEDIFERSDRELYALAGQGRVSRAMIDALLGFRERKRNAPVLIANVAGSLGVRDYESLNPADFSDRKVEKTSFSINATIGVSRGRSGFFFGGGYQYRRDYSDPEKRVLCAPGSTTDCRSEIFDLPTPDVDHSAFGLVRFAAPIVINGVAPVIEVKVAYDFEDKLLGIQVPIYFLTNAEGGLRGGVRFTYESRGNDPDKKTTTFGVFLVKSFDQLGF